MILVKENDCYKRERATHFTLAETITFKIPNTFVFEKPDYDWYMTVALEKSDLVTENRHMLTSNLIMRYRNAIREGYQHQLDANLKNQFAHPRNQNTIKGIQAYIERIEKLST
jgi:hypothetical protein